VVGNCPGWQPTWHLTCAFISTHVGRWWRSRKKEVGNCTNLLYCTFRETSDGGMEMRGGPASLYNDIFQELSGSGTSISAVK
jgi:hypothetical protein